MGSEGAVAASAAKQSDAKDMQTPTAAHLIVALLCQVADITPKLEIGNKRPA